MAALNLLSSPLNQVFPDGTTQDSFRVMFEGRVCAPDFKTETAAQAHLDILNKGGKPEYLPIFPTLNINGTSAESLLDDLSGTIHLLQLALAGMADVQPHGRDYPGQARDFQQSGNRSLRQAVQDHVGRLTRIKSVIDELNVIRENIDQQHTNRQRSRRVKVVR